MQHSKEQSYIYVDKDKLPFIRENLQKQHSFSLKNYKHNFVKQQYLCPFIEARLSEPFLLIYQ